MVRAMETNASTSPAYDAGNQRQVERREKAVRVRLGQLKEALRWLLADRRGRLYLAELVRESGALQRVAAADPQTVMFLDGQRSLGFKVLHDARALDDDKLFLALVASTIAPNGDIDHGRDDSAA
jgi:hypothetical protein